MADDNGIIIIPAASPPSDPSKAAALIFLHGLGDDAEGWTNVAAQFQAANKLPHLEWCFPNAPENMDAMQRAWFTPTRLSPFPSSRPELDEPEDIGGMMKSLKDIEKMIDDVVAKGVPANRVVLGGFSQGCAMTLLCGLVSKWAGKLGGLVCLHGFLPLADRIAELRETREGKVDSQVPIFIARGTKDMLIPKRYWTTCMEELKQAGVSDDSIEPHEYEGLGHSVSGEELRQLCIWLEKVIPSVN
jgi:lysophospholipase I